MHFRILSSIIRYSMLLLLLIGIPLTACSLLPSQSNTPVVTLPSTLTLPPQVTSTLQPTDSQQPICTPPPCAPDEAYHCPDECPGGCGTTCATHTPTTDKLHPTVTHQQQPSNAQSFLNPADFQWDQIASGLSSPIGITHAGNASDLLFVIEQAGAIRILLDGQLLPIPFLDIHSHVGSGGNEQGLLGLAFHPDYAQNGTFFINYTDLAGNTVVSRLQVSADPFIADANTETPILHVKQPYGNHNGGHLAFSPDGYLYIGLGDGGSADDPEGNGQNPSTLLGKMLRLDIDNGTPYAIPPDNPSPNNGEGLPEIWFSGLRNPWRYSFDRLTGDLYIGDVGQNQWEEINFWAAGDLGGANFGWDFWEGLHPFDGSPPQNLAFEFPIWEYGHNLGCSVTGGVICRGSMPDRQGIYIYGDFCSGRIWGLLRDANNTLLFETDFNIAAFGEDEAGEIYLVDRAGGIYQLTNK